ncbi:histidine kinase [Paludibaculum fermentans]|uniref:Histidine kinase n=1 Tax=Paludibaculum fermentans TaxID=1473598 RepID=A0A7S7NLE9_PALFE|nr:histidine kinase [Paludibaculum fermentans]QOY85786.1 histidine kinase [Paludibaculum fermentans]
MEKQFIILLIKLAAAASIASILARSSKFLNLLLRERRTMLEQLQLSLGISGFCGTGSIVRIYTQSYAAADMCLEGSLLAGLIGGYISGLLTGVICSIPALLHGEYLAMPLYAAVGVMGGLLRDLAYDQEEVWRISPFFDLSVYRLIRYPEARRRSLFQIVGLFTIVLAELMRYTVVRLFGERMIFAFYLPQGGWANTPVFVSTIFTVALPLKIWVSARNERLLENKERLLVEARLSALSAQINPHFLFNTLNTVSSLIRTNPDKARQVVYKLSNILRRLLRKTDNFAPLREELAFIDDYLSIEMTRFGDKLRFVKDVEPGTLDCQIPAMLLQPLVENSIKHGLARKVDGGTIRLESRFERRPEGLRLLLTVADDGVGIEEERLESILEQPGIGVSNVNERLLVLFGANYRLSVTSQSGEGTKTVIEIPA